MKNSTNVSIFVCQNYNFLPHHIVFECHCQKELVHKDIQHSTDTERVSEWKHTKWITEKVVKIK